MLSGVSREGHGPSTVSRAWAETEGVPPVALAVAVLTITPAGADDETRILKFPNAVPPTGRPANVLQTNPPARRVK